MQKIAIFVEGMTEQEFVEKLIRDIAGSKKIELVFGRQFQGKVVITPKPPHPKNDFYALIVNCACEDQVKTQIIEQYPYLVAANYSHIFGLRDIYPAPISDLHRIEALLASGLPTAPISPAIFLAVMEVEAWFIGEQTHFQRIDKSLTPSYIVSNGIDIKSTKAESWGHPAKVLDDIYKLASYRYLNSKGKKTTSRVRRTINALSFLELRSTVRKKLNSLDQFLSALEYVLK